VCGRLGHRGGVRRERRPHPLRVADQDQHLPCRQPPGEDEGGLVSSLGTCASEHSHSLAHCSLELKRPGLFVPILGRGLSLIRTLPPAPPPRQTQTTNTNWKMTDGLEAVHCSEPANTTKGDSKRNEGFTACSLDRNGCPQTPPPPAYTAGKRGRVCSIQHRVLLHGSYSHRAVETAVDIRTTRSTGKRDDSTRAARQHRPCCRGAGRSLHRRWGERVHSNFCFTRRLHSKPHKISSDTKLVYVCFTLNSFMCVNSTKHGDMHSITRG